ncbi:restriction endonuclease [Lachnospira multipara]|uniref:restriction endonuclease n=1 Tax=Lachnospira multipara TaxID=28051 RepID=UPI00068A0FE0|nr:restriction endonuclease [Lachnospira multipara]
MTDAQYRNNFKEAEEILNEHGIDIPSFIEYQCSKNPSFLQMSDDNHKLFCSLYDEVFTPSSTTKSKGNKLEDLTTVLFEKAFPNIFDVRKNCRTSSNEIDLLIRWKDAASRIGLINDFYGLGNTFLCECKNYEGKVSVTYIGKFFSLMSYTNTRLGVLVAWDGVTGKGWADGLGLIKKIALADKRYIIVITKDDLFEVYQKKKTVFELLRDKYHSLKNDIMYDKYISKHEAEKKL